MKNLKNAVNAAGDALAGEAIELSDAIWEFAEEPFLEFKSAAAIRNLLGKKGFRPDKEFRNIPTAFIMKWGTGRPRIGVMAEYDALPDCGLKKGTWGHGCGHNLLGAGSTLAALIAQAVMQKRPRLRGTICLIGCPAEETLAGKAYMARDGAFHGFNAILAWHPSSTNTVSRVGGAALNSIAFEFFGRTAHGSSAHNGRSALDAAELMDHAVNVLREHVPDNIRIHSIISVGGIAPNVVPEYARSWYYVRGRDRKEVDAVTERVIKCAKGGAIATETQMKHTLLTAIYNRLPNDVLVEHLQKCLQAVGPTPFDKKDERALKQLGLKGTFTDKIDDIAKTEGRASSDEDTVSWCAPLGRLTTACSAKGIPGHHRDMTRQGKSSFAHKGMIQAGKVLALAALGLLADAGLRKRAKKEFEKRTADFRFDPIVPKGQLPPIRDRIPHAPPTAP